MHTRVELLMVGNELLIGQVKDTNSHWLIEEITHSGAEVRKVTLVRDEPEAVGSEVQSFLQRENEFLFVIGGLGPTYDDQTLAAVSSALGRSLELHSEALAFVKKFYVNKYGSGEGVKTPEITESRKKMAVLPVGSVPLENTVGAAPGVWIDEGEKHIVCLPGVPQEMKDIFTKSMSPLWEQYLKPMAYREILVEGGKHYESEIADEIGQLHEKWQDKVYIKTNPRYLEDGVKMVIIFAARGEEGEIDRRLQGVLADAREILGRRGIELNVIPVKDGSTN